MNIPNFTHPTTNPETGECGGQIDSLFSLILLLQLQE